MEPHDGQSQVSLPDHGSVTILYYRPQRSWGKVMFLHVSVILFTEGWGGGLSLCPGSGGGSQSLSGGVSVMETPCAVMNGRYASYWNAFLFSRNLTRSKGKEGTRN